MCVTWDAETSPHWPLLSPVHHAPSPPPLPVQRRRRGERGHLRFRARTSHCALLSAVSHSVLPGISCSSSRILEKGANNNWLLYSGFRARSSIRNRLNVNTLEPPWIIITVETRFPRTIRDGSSSFHALFNFLRLANLLWNETTLLLPCN